MKSILKSASFFIFSVCFSTVAYAATEITEGVLYQSGTNLKSSRFGVTISVPTGWQATIPKSTETLIMEPINDATSRFIISSALNSSDIEIRTELTRSITLGLIQLHPYGKAIQQGKFLVQKYKITGSNSQDITANAYARLGNNTATYLLALRMDHHDNSFQLAEHLMDTAIFINPISKATEATTKSLKSNVNTSNTINWKQKLKGRTLRYMRTANGLSVKKSLNLCSNQSFSYSDDGNYISGNFTNFSNSNVSAKLPA